ncbi:extracellular solute-binding protein [Cohnella lupini]|uniref:Carbohydrate ABC transporter substrate-binding protein (CUT1 family) n=1 Tax=Cohnella lupini TaxID=1294267 RepID=A0A3D9IJ21_9BACL|nr:extracellular solute-binding protein [Cohnella lupini]RED61784.1 carbohydrate ABC transporter substrate-binding protein (CUT1 family) [Cohnella lupini]
MKKSLALGLCALLMTLLLAACGGNNNEPQSSPASSDPAASAPAESSAAPTESAAEEKPVTISFMHFKSDVTDGVQKIVDQFEEANPNITVDVQPVKYDDYYTLLKTKMAGGDVVDVFTLNNGAQTKLFVDGGYVEDLTGQPLFENFDPSVVKAQETDGKNYIVPVNATPIAVFYNKKIFSDLGIAIPRTYDELIAAGKKIKEAGKTPFALGWKDGWTLGMWIGRDLPSNTALVENQPDFFAQLETGAAKFADNPATRTMIQHAKQIFDLGNKDQLGVDYNGVVDLFAKGDVGMMYMGTWPLADIQKKNPELYETGIGYFPYPFSNDASLNKLEFNPDASLAVGSNSKNKEAALKFVAFMASKEGGDSWVKNINSLSYVKGASADIAPAVTELQPYFDNGEVYDSQVYIKSTIDWQNQFVQNLQKLFFNKATEDEVIATMDDWVSKNHK